MSWPFIEFVYNDSSTLIIRGSQYMKQITCKIMNFSILRSKFIAQRYSSISTMNICNI